jgi:hypothetical protein
MSPKQVKRCLKDVIYKILSLKVHVLWYILEIKFGQVFITNQCPQTAHYQRIISLIQTLVPKHLHAVARPCHG